VSDIKVLVNAIVEIEEEKALALTRQYLNEGVEPLTLFNAYQSALEQIGKLFEQQIYFLPELIMAGEMMKSASAIINPHVEGKVEHGPKRAKVLVATVEGDIHDIGKNIFTMMMEINGFDVKDIGVDVASEKIVAEAQAFGAEIIGLSGLLTLAFDPMKKVIEMKKKQMNNKCKVIIGGNQMDKQVQIYTGADAFATDAVAGVNICKSWVD